MAKKMPIPMELRYSFALGAWTSMHKGFLYALREKYGAAAALEIFERAYEMGDRVKNLTNTLLTIFNLQDNDAVTIGEVLDIWDEFTGIDSTILERSKTINRRKVAKCPFKTEPTDLSDWNLPFINILTKTINPKVTFERPKGMCAGDPYCEYVWKLEESTQFTGEVESIAKKLETPCAAPKREIPWELKYNIAMKSMSEFFRGWLYAIRETYGAETTLEICERTFKMGDTLKNFTKTLQQIFKIEGNDIDTIMNWWDIWYDICGYEHTWPERSKTSAIQKVTKCPYKVEYKDIGDFGLIFANIVNKTINPKATIEHLKGMCAGDPYCEYVFTIEE